MMPRFQQIPLGCELEPDGLILRMELVVPSDAQVIDNLVARIAGLLQGAPCGGDLATMELALHEALANAVVHGNRNNPAMAARVCLAVWENCRIQVVVKDVGDGFDPDSVSSPVAGENLLESHGRGIFLMRHMMDEVEFRFGGGTEIRLQHRGATNEEAKPVAGSKERLPKGL